MNISAYTAAELAAALAEMEGGKPLTRQRISAIAQEQGWSPIKIGTASLYPESEVAPYLAARRRTRLLNRAGWNPGGRLAWDDEPDGVCPLCGAFAVNRPLFQAANSAEYISGSWPWLCEQGHTSPTPDRG